MTHKSKWTGGLIAALYCTIFPGAVWASGETTSQQSKVCSTGLSTNLGVITKVMMNIPNWNSMPGIEPGNIGIKVKYINDSTGLFTTVGFTRLHTPHGRLLLQQAISAYLSQVPVYVLVDSDDTCQSGANWTKGWKGLIFDAPPPN